MRKFAIIFILLFVAIPVFANDLSDMDSDGVPDIDEINIYKTDPGNADTDGDGYSDWLELNNGFSPHSKEVITLEKADTDSDGLSDRMELKFGTDLTNPDTDLDGHKDGMEIEYGFDPNKGDGAKLDKRIEINTGPEQELSYFLGGVKLGSFKMSSGIPSMHTPRGYFMVDSKHPKAWSGTYGLWMPWWMSLQNGYFGIHELPEWPNGTKEGEDHLGTPASHGCVRLGAGDAEWLYNWTPMGTLVFIY